jgi:hypothetical protein
VAKLSKVNALGNGQLALTPKTIFDSTDERFS